MITASEGGASGAASRWCGAATTMGVEWLGLAVGCGFAVARCGRELAVSRVQKPGTLRRLGARFLTSRCVLGRGAAFRWLGVQAYATRVRSRTSRKSSTGCQRQSKRGGRRCRPVLESVEPVRLGATHIRSSTATGRSSRPTPGRYARAARNHYHASPGRAAVPLEALFA